MSENSIMTIADFHISEMTAETAAAIELHNSIVSAMKEAAFALVSLCENLKRMRDTGQYKALGFEKFEEYTEQACRIKKRQAYNYIATYERLGGTFLQSNAQLGITKLQLLTEVCAVDRADFVEQNDLEGMSVSEIKKLIAENKEYAEQISMFSESKEQQAHCQEQIHQFTASEMYRSRPVVVPVFQEIHIPERNNPDFIVLAFVHPEILFTPIQDVTLPSLKVGARIGHHKADAASGVAHPFIMGRIDLGHNFASHQHIRRLQDGIAEVFIDAADSKRIIRIIIQGYDLANRILVPEMDIGELPAHHTAVPGHTPVGLIALHQVIAEHFKEGAIRCHCATIHQFASDGKGRSRSNIGHAAALLDFREIVLEVFVQPIAHRDPVVIGNHIDPVRILLEGISGQLPLNIRSQQEHERH